MPRRVYACLPACLPACLTDRWRQQAPKQDDGAHERSEDEVVVAQVVRCRRGEGGEGSGREEEED